MAERSNRIVLKQHNKIDTHSVQIAIREQALNRYDLLKYNLDDALLIQEEIDVRPIYSTFGMGAEQSAQSFTSE